MARSATLWRSFRNASVVAFAVVIATLLTFPLASRMVHSRDLLFIAAVILVSRYEGWLPGMSVALLSVVAFDWFFDQTPRVLDFTTGNALRTVVFTGISLMVTLLDRQRRHALEKLMATSLNLQKALDEVKTLRGILPICSYCKKVMAGPETWIELEKYVRRHSEAKFSHGVCPECMQKYFPDIYQRK